MVNCCLSIYPLKFQKKYVKYKVNAMTEITEIQRELHEAVAMLIVQDPKRFHSSANHAVHQETGS